MAIVPLANEVSMLTIRNVINQRAVVLGSMRGTGTTYGLYGRDKETGSVEVGLKNISSSTINITVDLKRDGSDFGRTQTFNLGAGSKRTVTFSSLSGKTGEFTRGYMTRHKPAASYTGNHDYDLTVKENSGDNRTANINNINIASPGYITLRPVIFGNNYPTTKISIARDSGDITANYQLKSGVQIPKNLTTTSTPTNAKLSDWRGAQVIQGSVNTRSSRKGYYGDNKKIGYVHIYLDATGFSNGPVTVNLPNVKTITKNVSQTGFAAFKFDNLPGDKEYTFYITDTLTGISTKQKYRVDLRNYGKSLKYQEYSFNGTDQFLAFTYYV